MNHGWTQFHQRAKECCKYLKALQVPFFLQFFYFWFINTVLENLNLMASVLIYVFLHLFVIFFPPNECLSYFYITFANVHLWSSALDSIIVKSLDNKDQIYGIFIFHDILLLQWLHLGHIFRCLLWFFFCAHFLY